MMATLQRRIHLDRPQMLLLAFSAFLLLLNVFLVAGYLPADRQRDQLALQVSTVERAVLRLQARGAVGAGSDAALVPGENPFQRDLPTAELTNLVVQSAQAAGVRIDAITPQLGAPERLAYNPYRTYRVSLRAAGTAPQIADFLARIERGSVRAWVIDNIQARPSPAPATWDVSLDVIAYSQAS